MKMNQKMSTLLRQADISRRLNDVLPSRSGRIPILAVVDASILLKTEYERAMHVKPSDFPDKTGFECFVNHVHFPFTGTRDSILSCLGFARTLQHKLARMKDRHFQIIISIAEGECTIRFHEVRHGENWISSDLEGYTSEAILLLSSNEAPAREQ